MGKKMFGKDERKGENNKVEEGNSLKKRSGFMDKTTGNINDVSESVYRDDNKKRRKEGHSDKKKGRIKKSKSEFDTDEKESENVRKKYKKSKDGVSGVREAPIESCKAEKERMKHESSKAMCLENNVELEAKRLRKYKHKNKNGDQSDAIATAPETLEHSKLIEKVDVQKSCGAEDINEIMHEKEGEYLMGEKKKQKREKVRVSNSGHIAVITAINDGYEADQKKDQVHGNFVEEVEGYNNEKKRKKKSANASVGDEKPRKMNSGFEKHKFYHNNSEVNGNATVSEKEAVAVNNDKDGNRGEKKEKSNSPKSGSDGKKNTFSNGIEDLKVTYSNDEGISAGNVLKCRKLGDDVYNAENGKQSRKKKKKGKSRRSNSESKHDKEDAKNRKNVLTTDQSENSTKERSKKVSFSDHVEVFPCEDDIDAKKDGKEGLVQGKRFSIEEDQIVKDAVAKYIESHELGDEGLYMVLNCKDYPQTKNCWKEISAAIPWRPTASVYHRAHVLFERDDKHKWTTEELELVQKFVEKHGTNWRLLADSLGKFRHHVKDAWRRTKLKDVNKGHWSQEEYQNLFDLVNMDLAMKAFEERKSKHGMLRDNICWTAIGDKMQTRNFASCCDKWYHQLESPMVAKGDWANVDDYCLVDALSTLDACCMEDVNWDNLIEHRSGDACRKRWYQMVHHIGSHRNSSFAEQVEILASRYRPDMVEAREMYANKRPVDLPS